LAATEARTLVLAHVRALMTSSPAGATAFIKADLRYPGKILAHPELRATLILREFAISEGSAARNRRVDVQSTWRVDPWVRELATSRRRPTLASRLRPSVSTAAAAHGCARNPSQPAPGFADSAVI
jgi:S-adenosyl methyltransferase